MIKLHGTESQGVDLSVAHFQTVEDSAQIESRVVGEHYVSPVVGDARVEEVLLHEIMCAKFDFTRHCRQTSAQRVGIEIFFAYLLGYDTGNIIEFGCESVE